MNSNLALWPDSQCKDNHVSVKDVSHILQCVWLWTSTLAQRSGHGAVTNRCRILKQTQLGRGGELENHFMCIGNKEIYGICKACCIKCVLFFRKMPFKIVTFSHQILLFYFINQELYEMHWTDVTRVIKSRRIRWAEHVARIGTLGKEAIWKT